MIQRKRWRLSPAEKIDIWRRWKCGQSQHEIGRAFGRPHPTIRKILLPCGGIAPAVRRRSRLSLTLAEREYISRGIASDSSIREIAGLLKRSASTVSREVARHGGRPAYRAHDADRRAWVSALRPKRCLLAGNRRLREVVASKLILVARTDFRLAEDPLSQQREYARVPRDYLSQPVHSSARSIEERADGPSAVEAAHAPFATCQRTWTLPRADRRCHLHSRATSGGRRPSHSRPLGRRSARRWKKQLHCDVGGAALTLPHADQGAE
jgi:Helix-turn-helix domain/CENP-B N-terminal DNA-binding domain